MDVALFGIKCIIIILNALKPQQHFFTGQSCYPCQAGDVVILGSLEVFCLPTSSFETHSNLLATQFHLTTTTNCSKWHTISLTDSCLHLTALARVFRTPGLGLVHSFPFLDTIPRSQSISLGIFCLSPQIVGTDVAILYKCLHLAGVVEILNWRGSVM